MRILAIVSLVVGVLLLFFGLSSSQVATEQVVEAVSGRYTSATMWYIIGGVALIVAGGYSLIFGDRK